MSKVAVITDSNSGITQAQAEELGIQVVPMPFFVNGETFFEDIKVERVKDDETKQKVILHAKLNVFNVEDETFDLENFLLLFCKRQGCSFSYCSLCRW